MSCHDTESNGRFFKNQLNLHILVNPERYRSLSNIVLSM